ncbi:MAG: hypothetical protein IKZ09_08120, partial [Clostridia bacterium]|nr:hypothetical protein [Clostridia bacterium]
WGYLPIAPTDNPAVICRAAERMCAGRDNVRVRVLSFSIVPDAPNSNYNGNTYIDTMSKKAVKRFLELTHERYQASCGDRMGTSVRGIFTDEPHRGHAMDDLRVDENGVRTCSVCYTDDFFEEFSIRYGFPVELELPQLFYRPNGERFSPIKLYWFDLADKLFVERFARPINAWCKKHHIAFTGHVLHEDSLMNQSVPHGSLMRFYEHMGVPGVDVLTEHNRCYWIVKQLSSAARQLGKKWLLSELYGCTGWQFDFKSHKTVGDWQALFGINLRCHHLSWYTMEGESKRDYPASILHQSPWYRYYNDVETYFARFGAFMTAGDPICDVLVLNPVESVWAQAYLGFANWIFPDGGAEHIHALENHYANLFHILTEHHIDFDYGEEQMMQKYAEVTSDENGQPILRVGKMSYRAVVVSGMETVRPTTLALLKEFARAGGRVITAGDAPLCIDAIRSDEPAAFAREHTVCVPFDADALVGALKDTSACPITVTTSDGTAARSVFVQMRNFGDSTGFVLLNTDREQPTETLTVTVKTAHRFAECWDFRTGARTAYDVTADGTTLTLSTSLDAAGTQAFVLCDHTDLSLAKTSAPLTEIARIPLDGSFGYETNEQNVCVLDFARVRIDGGAWSDEMEILRADGHVRDHYGMERRGGEMLQPWFAALTDKRIYGKVALTLTFDIDEMPRGDLILAGERPERMHYAINGVALHNDDIHDFWVDDCFKKMTVPKSALKIGTNVVTAEFDFMRTTNIEALYLIGDFGVRLDGHSRTLTARPDTLPLGNLDAAAMPFYTGEVTYRITPAHYAALSLSDDCRVLLRPTAFVGGLIRVQTDGEDEQRLIWDPYEADITNAVRDGRDILLTVVGTRRNVFGPLHFAPRFDGAYGPGHFVTGGDAWTDDYALIDSGLHAAEFVVCK